MADETTQCDLAKEDISAYLDRELSGIDSARVEAHLRRCRECARERDLLKECRKLVGEIVEHRPSPALEALLIRRSQDYLDGFRAQRRRYRIALTARAWARRAILGALLVAVAAWGIYLIGRLWSARLAEVEKSREVASTARTPSSERMMRSAGVRKPARERRAVTSGAEDIRRARERPAAPPPGILEPDHTGWWRVSYGSPPADMGFVELVQDGTTVAMPGDTYVNGKGRLDGRRMVIARADAREQEEFNLEAELDIDGRSFVATAITSYDGGKYRSSVAIFGEKVVPELAAILESQAKAAGTVAQRERRLKKVYAALKQYAQERNGALPYELTELIPAYLDDPHLAVGVPGVRDIAYQGGLQMPSPPEDGFPSDARDVTPDEALALYAEGSEQRVEPFFTELVSETWTVAPCGIAVLYLDGTTAWESDPAAVPPLPQELVERRARQRMVACQDNMKQLGAVLGRWLSEWDGRYPLNLEMLYPEWLSDLRVLTCPEEEPHTICHEFVYSGEMRPAEEEFASPEAAAEYYATTPVIVEIGEPHFGGHNVLYMDGHVDWHPASERY